MTVRQYLVHVYPTAKERFSQVADKDLDALFSTIHYYYDGCSDQHCSEVLLRWLYEGFLPCEAEHQECVSRLAHFVPSWSRYFHVDAGWLEVEPPSIRDEAAEHSNSGALSYSFRRGSGIFYELGRAKYAPGKTAMLADLLLELSGQRLLSPQWPTIVAHLGFNSSTLSAGTDSLQLRALATGRRSCHSLGIRACRCYNTIPDSWDDAVVQVARLLGYDTLLLSASMLCQPGHPPSPFAEVVDVRPHRPSWLHDRLRAERVLSLRDPFNIQNAGSARPCNISAAGVGCEGHVSVRWPSNAERCPLVGPTCTRAVWLTSATEAHSPPAFRVMPSHEPGQPPSLPPKSQDAQTEPSQNGGPGLEGAVSHHHHHDVHHNSSSLMRTDGDGGTIYRFVFTGLRLAGHQVRDGMQLSEITLYAADDSEIQVVTSLNPGGQQPSARQGPSAACDGSLATKWFDSSLKESGSVKLLLQVAPGALPVASYGLFTANDNPRRDPSRWTLDVRDEGAGAWHLIDSAEGVVPPTERHAAYARRPVHYTRAGATPISVLAADEHRASAAVRGVR